MEALRGAPAKAGACYTTNTARHHSTYRCSVKRIAGGEGPIAWQSAREPPVALLLIGVPIGTWANAIR